MKARIDEHLLRAVEERFAGRATLSFKETADLLNVNEKTLRSHVRRGNIGFRQTGLGGKRVRREFALDDVVDFYAGTSRRFEETSQSMIVHVRRTARSSFLEGHAARRAAKAAALRRRG